MTCNACENAFNGVQSLVVSITRSGGGGSTATLFVGNHSPNVVLIERILLCAAYPGGGSTTLYLRAPPNQIAWTYPSTYLEQGITANYYTLTGLPAGTIVQAQAEYIAFESRARSCAM